MAYRDFKVDRFLTLNNLPANAKLSARAEGEDCRLWRAPQLTRPTYMTADHVCQDLAPHAVGAPAERLKAADHRNDDERADKPIFDCSCPTLVFRRASASISG